MYPRMGKKWFLLPLTGLISAALVLGGCSVWRGPDVVANKVIRFAIVTDPHIAIPAPGHTAENCPYLHAEPGRKLLPQSVELLTAATEMVNAIPHIDFVLMPGDFTKDSECYNHQKLLEMLAEFQAPIYVVAGNHDLAHPHDLYGIMDPNAEVVDADEVPDLYAAYWGPGGKPYYSVEPVPGIQLIALHSSRYEDHDGEIDPEQLAWLRSELEAARGGGKFTIVMLHHCIGDHVPAFKEDHPMYPIFDTWKLDNAEQVKSLLKEFGVQVVVTGHFHIHDIVEEDGIYDITTGATVTYPHPIRILELDLDSGILWVTTQLVEHIPSIPQLQAYSKEAMAANFFEPYVAEMLQDPPYLFPSEVAEVAAKGVRQMWPLVSAGDEVPEYSYTLADVFPEGTTTGDAETDARVQQVLPLLLHVLNGFFTDRWPSDHNAVIYLEPLAVHSGAR